MRGGQRRLERSELSFNAVGVSRWEATFAPRGTGLLWATRTDDSSGSEMTVSAGGLMLKNPD